MSVIRDTITLRSSIFDYEYENGRRYHAYKPGIYLLPNDDREQERLESTYHIWNLVLGGNLCLSELSNPRRILDIGTGTGSWAMDMGDQYPNAEIIGTDLSPIQHEEVPSNVRFEIDDCRDPWLYEEDYFDFIHIRTLAGAIQNWPRLLEQCYRHLKPGGKLEISEGRANFWWKNDTVPEDSYTYRWLKEWRRLAPQVQFDIFPFLPDMLRELPFTGLRPLEKLVPLGPWPHDKKLKEIGGEFLSLFLDNTLEAFTLALFTRTGGWKQLELEVLLAHVRQELMTGKMHLYTFW
ncbi:S-adenosyl-L-methionine-dependent methyltransferase [Neohortaea acidophila]|uniref:S-adenosyl-L-methionine-dependent methyltransferase n=1 Tax=Neohortaea acidophila TaxID=245834 RepID=A0A6A6Q186_9PEZI|nr:S-adenosyl-L-methionine-dependent methyltransferase [Neohortaea acidophila]KAF2486238.1 S-adenosyl-L-methionine-dependent methyltransferase [Neohortaea acidophila]